MVIKYDGVYFVEQGNIKPLLAPQPQERSRKEVRQDAAQMQSCGEGRGPMTLYPHWTQK